MYIKNSRRGFTIIELLIVIVVIGILTSMSAIVFNGIQVRAQQARNDADISLLTKAITVARINSGKTLGQVTGDYWSMGKCVWNFYNPGDVEPRSLPKNHVCWTSYYAAIDMIGQAAGMNLGGLKQGDSRGNPYALNENQGENDCTTPDYLYVYTGSGTTHSYYSAIPLYESCTVGP